MAHRTSDDGWGVESPPESKVFRLHYHSRVGDRKIETRCKFPETEHTQLRDYEAHHDPLTKALIFWV